MIIVKLSGGLGNQLFQYAAGKALAILNNAVLKLDLTSYQTTTNVTPRHYALDPFNSTFKIASPEELQKFTPSKIQFFNRLKKNKYIIEKSFQFDPTILALHGNIYLSGFWQSPKYFQAISALLQDNLTLKTKLSNDAQVLLPHITSTTAVSLHIRRGDYVTDPKTNQYHGTCGLDYYQTAVTYLQQHLNQPQFFIFSDDIQWVKENLHIDQPVTYLSNGKIADYEELMLMSQCKHHIIANSSFSWWGAWLNPSPTKIVIAPKKWFNDHTKNTADLLPNNWIKL